MTRWEPVPLIPIPDEPPALCACGQLLDMEHEREAKKCVDCMALEILARGIAHPEAS